MLSFEKEISSSLLDHMDYVSDSQLVIEIPTEILRPMTKVVIEFNSDKTKNIESFMLRHAFNHVMSDLVLDKEEKDLNLEDDFVYKFKTPKSASHILIDIKAGYPLKSLIKSLKVFVADDESVVIEDNTDHVDIESISYQKPVMTDFNNKYGYLVTDGSNKTIWQGDNYPANVDIDLESIYTIKSVKVYFPVDQNVVFDIYGSNDGLNYKFINHEDIEITNDNGYEILIDDEQLSFLRLNVLYNSGSDTVKVKQIRVFGDYLKRRDDIPVFKFLVDKDFSSKEMSMQQALKGIINRRIGAEYIYWFEFVLDEREDNYFKLENDNERIKIIGSTGVNIAAGLNYYLKYFCQVNISQQGMGDRIVMPTQIVKLDKTIEKKSTAKYIYSYNYTTFSYTMAFWKEDEWQAELDWLALNGVNLVLDPIGQEAVWALFLRELGYIDREIQRQVSFSTYSAWQWMGNISGVGGPVSLDWINDRTKLAHRNHQFMKALGMNPIYRAYGGLLPDDLNSKQKNLDIIVQGQWCSFHRPDMLKTSGRDYQKLSKMFYQIQESVLGKITHFYSVDPFHEGGIMGDMTAEDVSKNLMLNLLDYDDKAIWIIQSWQENPTPGLLKGIENSKKEHALVLDLYAEKSPQWIKENPKYHGGKEFSNTPWLFCMLNNFGGRMGLGGHLSDLRESYERALNDSQNLKGIGITPEASLNNPILYDYFFELVWTDNENRSDNNIDEWLGKYARRRYGQSKKAVESLAIQLKTVYRSEFNNLGQGAPESVINARPSNCIQAASTWGNAVIEYSKKDLINALEKLFFDFDVLQNSEGYRFDLVSLTMQVISNYSQDVLGMLNKDIDEKNIQKFLRDGQVFKKMIELVNQVENEISIYRLKTWENQANSVVKEFDDFTKKRSRIDARAIVTTWGSIKQSNSGGLHDYSNRQWSGLTDGLYAKRWEKWLSEQEDKLKGKTVNVYQDHDWFKMEWDWVIEKNKDEVNSRKDISLKDVVKRTLEIIDYE